MRKEPTTRAEWDAAYAAKHRDFKGVHSDDRHPDLNGRRTMLWLVDGVTTLLVEPDWNAPRVCAACIEAAEDERGVIDHDGEPRDVERVAPEDCEWCEDEVPVW